MRFPRLLPVSLIGWLVVLAGVPLNAQVAPAAQKPPLKFAKAGAYSSGGIIPDSIAIGDLNGDGIPDLVVGNDEGDNFIGGVASVLLGNGDGTFQAPVTYSYGATGYTVVAVGDVNGDGILDLVMVSGESNSLGVLLGNGDGTFQPA